MEKKTEIILEYQNYIESPPVPPNQLYGQACSSDAVTINTWRAQWIAQFKANQAKFGPFKEKSIGKLHGQCKNKSIIVAGSGPSLKRNGKYLKDKGDIPLISCLHNFHFLEDLGVDVDYYVSLDAGEVTVEEVSEGGSKAEAEYWEMTKKRKLLAFAGTHPKLLEKWQGEIYFFNAPVADAAWSSETEAIEPFHMYVSTGGNVLGAATYIAKGVLGATVTAFVGADFAFGYDKKFHAWDSKYDKNLGYVLKAVDVFGNKVLTWQSYANFKAWFDYIALKVPGIYVNCTEGGTFGSYADGNIMAVKQMDLIDFIEMHGLSDQIKGQCEDPLTVRKHILF